MDTLVCPFCGQDVVLPAPTSVGDGGCKCGARFTMASSFSTGSNGEERMTEYLAGLIAGSGFEEDESNPDPLEIETKKGLDVNGFLVAVFARRASIVAEEEAWLDAFLKRTEPNCSPVVALLGAVEYLEKFVSRDNCPRRIRNTGIKWIRDKADDLVAQIATPSADSGQKETH